MAVEFHSEAEQPEQGPGHSGKHLLPPLSWDHSSYQPCAGLGTRGTTLGALDTRSFCRHCDVCFSITIRCISSLDCFSLLGGWERGPSFWEARNQQWTVAQALKCVAVKLDAHKRDPLTDTGALRMGLRPSFSTGRPGDL